MQPPEMVLPFRSTICNLLQTTSLPTPEFTVAHAYNTDTCNRWILAEGEETECIIGLMTNPTIPAVGFMLPGASKRSARQCHARSFSRLRTLKQAPWRWKIQGDLLSGQSVRQMDMRRGRRTMSKWLNYEFRSVFSSKYYRIFVLSGIWGRPDAFCVWWA